MKSINPYVLVVPYMNHKKEHQLTDDVTIHIKTELNKNLRESHPQLGRVVAIPQGQCKSMDHRKKFDCVLEIGDDVIVSHFSFLDHSWGKQDSVMINGEEAYPVHYEEIYMADRNGELIMTNDYVLAEEIIEENFSSSFLIVPETSKKVLKNKYKVLHLPNVDTELNVGDIVTNDKRFPGYKLTYKGKDYVRCVLDELVAVEKV